MNKKIEFSRKYVKSSVKPENVNEFIKLNNRQFGKIIKSLDECIMQTQLGYKSKLAWGGWGYMLGKNYSNLIVQYKDHIKLMIWRGKLLNDSMNLLKGVGSNTRHLKIKTIDDINCTYIKDLLVQQKKLYDNGIKYEK